MPTFKYDGEIMARALLSHHLDTAVSLAGEAGLDAMETLALRAIAARAADAIKPAWAPVEEPRPTPPPSNPFTPRKAAPEPVNRKVAASILGISTKTLDKWTAAKLIKRERGGGFDPEYLKGIDAAALLLRKRRK